MIETLSTRTQRLATKASTKRLFYLCALVGLVSLVGVSVVLLPWHVLYTQGHWVGFVFLAMLAFCWFAGPLAAMGQLELDLPTTARNVSWVLALTMIGQVALGLYFEYQFVTRKSDQIAHCLELDPAFTSESCSKRINSIIIAFPLIVFLSPVLSVPLLYSLFRQTALVSLSPHLYSTLDDTSSDLPPNWQVPPRSFAPDSSASDNDEDDEGNLSDRERQVLQSRGRASPVRNEDGTGDAWFELGKREKRSDSHRAKVGRGKGTRWSEVRRNRKGNGTN